MIVDNGMISLCANGCYCMTKTKMVKGALLCAKCDASKDVGVREE